MQCRPLVQNRRVKRLQYFSIEGFPRRFPLLGRWKKIAGRCLSVCLSVCPSVQAFSSLEPEQLVGSGRSNIHSIRRNGGKTMVTVLDRWLHVPRATCDRANPCQKVVSQGVGKRIRLKLGGPMAIIGWQNLFGDTMMLPSLHVPDARAK